MYTLNESGQNVSVVKGEVYSVIRTREDKLHLVRIKYPRLDIEPLCSFRGKRSFFLGFLNGLYIISIDNRLLISSDLLEWRTVLQLKDSNSIWHVCVTPNYIVAQEYGETPTRLYYTSDCTNWKPLLSNLDVDMWSKHFHYAAYDKYRDALWVTLGDGNLVKLAKISIIDGRVSYKHIYRGVWQFVPVWVEENRLILGMDSGIAPGGIGILDPLTGKMQVTFLRHSRARHAQFTCLMKLGDVWLSALGSPEAILVSKDLRYWYPLVPEVPSSRYNHNVMISTEGQIVAACMSDKLVIATANEIKQALVHFLQTQEPTLREASKLERYMLGLKELVITIWRRFE